MPTVLVGVDAYERSLDAVAFARQVVSASGASVLVANAFPYEDRPSRIANRAYREALKEESLETVRRISAELSDLEEGRVRQAVVANLSPAHGLHDIAEEEHADLMIVGSSHVSAFGRVMPGSTGERLLHGATCPVAIVPKGYHSRAQQIRRIGVAYDGSPEADVAVRAAVEVARSTGAELRVIRVVDALSYRTPATMGIPNYALLRDDIEGELRAELDETMNRLPADISAEPVFLSGNPAHELAVQSGTLDLLVTGSRGYGPLRAVMVGAVTGRLVRDAACPVLVVPRGVESPLGRVFARGAEAPA